MNASTFIALIASVLALCSFNALVGRVEATEITFSNRTFSNGTNLVANFQFTEDYATQQVNCTLTFPSNKVFLKVQDTYYATLPGNVTFTLYSDISAQTLTTGNVFVYNNGTIYNGTDLTYFLLPYDQQKNGPFTFTFLCNAGGQVFNQTINADVHNGGAASLSSFLSPLLSYLF